MDTSKLTTHFAGYIKQLNTSSLDVQTTGLIDDCFPDFNGLIEVSKRLRSGSKPVDYLMGSKGMKPVTEGRIRRFSGGNTLPRGKYFSVCSDASGNDGGTLVWELMSYWNADAKKFPELIDSTVHKEAKEEYQQYFNFPLDKPFLLLIANNINGVYPEGDKYAIDLGGGEAVVMPLIIKKIRVENVLDLRVPHIQDAFSDFFGDLEISLKENKSIRVFKEKPRNFFHLLHTLLCPDPGGCAFHEGIGAYCRQHGINGMVFPSARRNSYVKATKDNEILSFDGWNFVDFRNAPEMKENDYKEFFGLQPKWLHSLDTGFKIYLNENDKEREWLLEGIEEGERLRYDISWYKRAYNIDESVVWNERIAARERSENNLRKNDREYIKKASINLKETDQVQELLPENYPISLIKHIRETIDFNKNLEEAINQFRNNVNVRNHIKTLLRVGQMTLQSPIRLESVNTNFIIGELLLACIEPDIDTCFEPNFNLGESWFFYRYGTCDAEIQIKCPVCDDEMIWPVLQGYILPMCRVCSFTNGQPESPESIRNRFLNWAKS